MKCTAKLVKPKKCKLQTKILLGLPGSHLLVFKSTNTNMDKIFETNSCFLVKERTAGKVQLRFFRRYLLVLKKKCLFWRKTIILWSLEIFLIFLNFLRTYFFFLWGQSLPRPPPPPPHPQRRSATHEATRTYNAYYQQPCFVSLVVRKT